MQAIMEMQGTPQRPNPGNPGLHIPIQIRLEPEVPVDMEEMRPSRNEDTPKERIERTIISRSTGTRKSVKDVRVSAGMAARPHTEDCRKRMYEAMRKTENGRGRLEKADDKTNAYLEENRKTERKIRREA